MEIYVCENSSKLYSLGPKRKICILAYFQLFLLILSNFQLPMISSWTPQAKKVPKLGHAKLIVLCAFTNTTKVMQKMKHMEVHLSRKTMETNGKLQQSRKVRLLAVNT